MINVIVGVALGCLGNRIWGAEGQPRWLAVLFVTLGCAIANPHLLVWSPLVALLFYFFRVWPTGPSWLAEERGGHEKEAILRSMCAAVMPLAVFLLDGSFYHLIFAVTFPVIALFYYTLGRLIPTKATEICEVLTGGYFVASAI